MVFKWRRISQASPVAVAMENGPFVDDFAIKAMLVGKRVWEIMGYYPPTRCTLW